MKETYQPVPVQLDLRDYFAAKAMQSFLTGLNEDQFVQEGVAIMAYQMADAMMKERLRF